MHRLILVEGIPGSGKSTFARRIAEHYTQKGRDTRLYIEGELHPADLAWTACVPADALPALLAPYADLREQIDRHTALEDGYAYIAYTQVRTDNLAFYAAMEPYEVYDGRVPLDTFTRLHMARWRAFGEAAAADTLTVFECALLQNHVNELLYYHLADDAQIQAHIRALMDMVLPLSPVLVYLTQPDIGETIARVASKRQSAYGAWIDRVIEFVETSPYGVRHGLRGMDGVVRSMQERRRIELAIIDTLPMECIVLDNPRYDWEAVWQTLQRQLPG